MEQNPWKANGHTASHKIFCLLWNLKVYYCLHNRPPLVPILNCMNPDDILTPYFCKTNFNIILLGFPNCLFTSCFPTKILYTFLTSYIPSYPTYSHLPWFDHSNIWWRGQIIKLFVIQICQLPITSSPLSP